ncbi:hypothetical protein [Acinetobacter johnsonii]|uniref:hypothetical protein n=1 Tax=Acinetobacter johnsonii TaxID=40214 RepID=UPI003AF9D941
MIWNSFKDKKGLVQSFEVDKYQEDILRFIEVSMKATPLVANTPKKGRVSVCYRLNNGNEIGILLNDSAPTIYLNEKVVEKYLISDLDFSVLVQDIRLHEKGGHIFPHSIYKLPNTTVLRPSLKTLCPTVDNSVFCNKSVRLQIGH